MNLVGATHIKIPNTVEIKPIKYKKKVKGPLLVKILPGKTLNFN